jgi:hypothetical protein
MKKIILVFAWILYTISFLVTPFAIIWQMANEHADEIAEYLDEN